LDVEQATARRMPAVLTGAWPPSADVREQLVLTARVSRRGRKTMERIWECLNGFTQFSTVLISSIALVFHIKWSRRATALGPTILTTLGIFFCFAGIAWGCWISTRTTFEAVSRTCSAESAQRSGHPWLGYFGHSHSRSGSRCLATQAYRRPARRKGPPWTTWPFAGAAQPVVGGRR